MWTQCKDDLANVFGKFESSFQTQNTQWNYHKEAYILKQQEGETVEQLEIRLTNVLKMQLPMRQARQLKSLGIIQCFQIF